MDKKIIAALGFTSGVIIGANWSKIKKYAEPLWNNILKFKATQKKELTPKIEAAEVTPEPKKKKAKPQKKTVPTKKIEGEEVPIKKETPAETVVKTGFEEEEVVTKKATQTEIPEKAEPKKEEITTPETTPKILKEITEIEEKILSILKENPKGKTLTDLSSIFGVHFIKLTIPLQRLVNEGKVSKKGKVYHLQNKRKENR